MNLGNGEGPILENNETNPDNFTTLSGQQAVRDAENLLRSKALEDRDRTLSEMRASRGDGVFASLPIKVVEDLRHFELDIHDVVQSVTLMGKVGTMRAWEVVTLRDPCIVVYDESDDSVCGRFNEDGDSLDIIALLYGIVDRTGGAAEVHKRILEGEWPE